MEETELALRTSQQLSLESKDEKKETVVSITNLREQLSNVFSDDTNKLHELDVKLKKLNELNGFEINNLSIHSINCMLLLN